MTPRPTGRLAGGFLPVGLMAAPFQVAISVFSTLLALVFLVNAQHIDSGTVSILQTILSPPWVWVWTAFLGGGGVATLVGIFSRTHLATEVIGLCLMASAWLVYAVALYFEASSNAFIPMGLGFIVAAASVVRVRALLVSSSIAERTGSSRVPEE